MNESLQTALTRLRLSGLAASLDVRVTEAAGHRLSHMEFLELLLQDELLVRNQRRGYSRPPSSIPWAFPNGG